MKIENQVVSLELAKEMKEAGFPQDSYWYWTQNKSASPSAPFLIIGGNAYYEDLLASAPTVAELGEMLPELMTSLRKYDVWHGDIDDSYKDEFVSSTEADARAKMWLYLKKEGLLK